MRANSIDIGRHERRRRRVPETIDGLLEQLPGRIVLDRISTPILGVSIDGKFEYANPACALLLGYGDVTEVLEQSLSTLLVGHPFSSARECVAALREAGQYIVSWRHVEGFAVHTAVSSSLLLRATDPLLLFEISDLTESLWLQNSLKRRALSPAIAPR
jgi:PAS domain-containing protein